MEKNKWKKIIIICYMYPVTINAARYFLTLLPNSLINSPFQITWTIFSSIGYNWPHDTDSDKTKHILNQIRLMTQNYLSNVRGAKNFEIGKDTFYYVSPNYDSYEFEIPDGYSRINPTRRCYIAYETDK